MKKPPCSPVLGMMVHPKASEIKMNWIKSSERPWSTSEKKSIGKKVYLPKAHRMRVSRRNGPSRKHHPPPPHPFAVGRVDPEVADFAHHRQQLEQRRGEDEEHREMDLLGLLQLSVDAPS